MARDDDELSGAQRLARRMVPARWFEEMRTESQEWRIECPCGWQSDVWTEGGIRWRARGMKKLRARCKRCDARRWMTVRRVR